MVLHNVGDGLGVGGGTGAAAPDGIVDLGEFVCDTVGYVGAGGSAGVGAEDDAVGEIDGHAGGGGSEGAWWVSWWRGLVHRGSEAVGEEVSRGLERKKGWVEVLYFAFFEVVHIYVYAI